MTKRAVLEHARQLPADEQIELATELLDAAEADQIGLFGMSPEFQAELDRRIEEDEQDATPAVEWEVLRAQLLRGEI